MALDKSIKGLNIIIGSDTTALGKALGDVTKQSGAIGKELGQVNKLLKFSPNETTLLAQKQELLGDQIKNTKEQLDTLKEAEKQAQEQFAKGDISAAQYRAVQREVVEATSKLKHYEDQLKDTNKEKDRMKMLLGENNGKLESFAKSVGGAAVKGVKVLAASLTGAVVGLVALSESTTEYREDMAKLETGFTTAGHSADDAKEVYRDFYAILGETDRSVEAVNHLAKLTTTQEELADWTTIATGVFATFGDSLPIEGLTEAANETAKTGELTGVLADALNWAGIHEDDFKAKLEATNSEQERSELITETLLGLYTEQAEKYREVNAEVIASREQQEKFNEVMAELGGAVSPVIGKLKEELLPIVQEVTNYLIENMPNIEASIDEAISFAEEAFDKFGDAIAWVKENMDIILPALAGVTAAITAQLIINTVQKGYAAFKIATEGTTIAQAALNLVMSANPFGIVAIAIGALVTAGILLYKNWDTVKEKATELFAKVKEAFDNIKTSVTETINGLIESALSWGKNLVEGFWNGIDSLKDWLKSKVLGWVEGIGKTIKDFFGIASPSKLMAEYGKNIDEGLAEGITANEGIPLNAIQSVGEKMAAAASNAAKTVMDLLTITEDSYSISGPAGTVSYDRKSSSKAYSDRKQSDLTKYADEIAAIAEKYNVDMSVGYEMFKSNELDKIYGRDETYKSSSKSSGITQNITVNSPKALTPSEIARETAKAATKLVLPLLR